MKILQIVPCVPPATVYGSYRYASEVSRALVALGHSVHFLTGKVGQGTLEEDWSGVTRHLVEELYSFDGYNHYLDSVLAAMPQGERLARVWVKHGPFDLVSAHDWAGGLVAVVAKRAFGCPLVATLHGTEVGRRAGKLTREQVYVADMERWLCERADRVIAPSRFTAGELEKHVSISAHKVAVIPGGAGPETFKLEVDADEFRGMFAGPRDPLVLFAGRLEPDKGPDVLLEAVVEVTRSVPGIQFVFAGDGSLRPELEKTIEGRRLRDSVRLVGHLGSSVLGALYRVADLLVIPSRYESFGIAALEGLYHGLPVIASNQGGLIEAAGASDRVKLVPSGDSAALSRAITEALRRNKTIKTVIPPDIERVPDRFRWKRVAEATTREYESILHPVKA